MQNATPESESKPAVTARSLNDDWYLKAYGTEEGHRKHYARKLVDSVTNLKSVSLAVVVGLCVGLGVAAFRPSRPMQMPMPTRVEQKRQELSQAVPAPSTAAALNHVNPQPSLARETTATVSGPAELERIRVRNRRLEALVAVLRQRKHAPEKRITPDSSNLFGQ